MICDAMVLANNELKISKSTETPEAFMLMTDCIVKVKLTIILRLFLMIY